MHCLVFALGLFLALGALASTVDAQSW